MQKGSSGLAVFFVVCLLVIWPQGTQGGFSQQNRNWTVMHSVAVYSSVVILLFVNQSKRRCQRMGTRPRSLFES